MVWRSLSTAAQAATIRLFRLNGMALCPTFIPLSFLWDPSDYTGDQEFFRSIHGAVRYA
jgi:hypothetical protein